MSPGARRTLFMIGAVLWVALSVAAWVAGVRWALRLIEAREPKDAYSEAAVTAAIAAKCREDAPESPPGAVVPALRVDPHYPQPALDAGTEGSVDLTFTVLADGTVSALAVVESEPEGVFDDAAAKAVGRWRYCPDDSLSDDARRVRVRLNFKLHVETEE